MFWGPFTLRFPLSLVVLSPHTNPLVSGGPRYRLARDCIRFEPSIGRVVHQVLGSIVICDTLEDANHLRFERGVSVKCVSLDGSIIAKNGNMTGGVAGDHERRAAKWDTKKLADLESRREKLTMDADKLKRCVPSCPAVVPCNLHCAVCGVCVQESGQPSRHARGNGGLGHAYQHDQALSRVGGCLLTVGLPPRWGRIPFRVGCCAVLLMRGPAVWLSN